MKTTVESRPRWCALDLTTFSEVASTHQDESHGGDRVSDLQHRLQEDGVGLLWREVRDAADDRRIVQIPNSSRTPSRRNAWRMTSVRSIP